MRYTEFTITTDRERLETVCAVAEMASQGGFYVEDYADMEQVAPTIRIVDYYDEQLLKKRGDDPVVHIYVGDGDDADAVEEFLRERLSCVPHTLSRTETDDSEWADAWKKYYKPLVINERLTVCPSWEEYEKTGGEAVLRIDPAQAFGSGTHETTRLCLVALCDMIQGGERVLDMGCGSGILGIAAALLGASETTAVDISAVAAQTARDNAALNGVDMRVLCGDAASDERLKSEIGGGYDVVVANIVADVIIAFSKLFYDALRAGGTLVASGIIDARCGEVAKALQKAGLSVAKTLDDNGWRAIIAVKE